MNSVESIGVAATSAYEIIKRALSLVSGEVDFGELERVVVAAELAAPGLQSAVVAIKQNETTIFKDEIARLTADAILSVLVAASKLAA